MDVGIPHTLMEYAILLLFGGGGAWKAHNLWQNRPGHGTDAPANKDSTKLKEYIEKAHEPLLKELKSLCKVTEGMRSELHDYIVIQKDRDQRRGV